MSPVREEKLVFCNAPLVGGAMDVSAEQVKTIVDATADAGFGGVSLWAFHHLAAVGDGVSPEQVKAWHVDRGLSVPVVESLIGWEGGDETAIDQQCGSTLDVARFYGAETVAGVVMSAELDSFDAASAGLAHLARRAEERGLKVCIEWLPWSGVPDLATAWKLVDGVGAANVGLVLDTWHWLRQPGGPDFETLARVPGERIHVVQLDDTRRVGSGDDMMMESMTQRLLPGEGEVDFPALLSALEDIGADPIWSPEVFNVELLEKGPVEMARRTLEATRRVLGL